MDFKNLDEYYEYLENDTNFQYLDLNTYKYITAEKETVGIMPLQKAFSKPSKQNSFTEIVMKPKKMLRYPFFNGLKHGTTGTEDIRRWATLPSWNLNI